MLSNTSPSQSHSTASVLNKVVKIIVLAHQSYAYDQLGGRTPSQIQLELSSERKKYQGYAQIQNEDAFESMLE